MRLVHWWWVHNDYARKPADMLVDLGYTAITADVYYEKDKLELFKSEWKVSNTRFLKTV